MNIFSFTIAHVYNFLFWVFFSLSFFFVYIYKMCVCAWCVRACIFAHDSADFTFWNVRQQITSTANQILTVYVIYVLTTPHFQKRIWRNKPGTIYLLKNYLKKINIFSSITCLAVETFVDLGIRRSNWRKRTSLNSLLGLHACTYIWSLTICTSKWRSESMGNCTFVFLYFIYCRTNS